MLSFNPFSDPLKSEPQTLWGNIKKKLKLNSKPVLAAVIIFFLTIVLSITTLIVLVTINSDEESNKPGGILQFVSREEWNARPPKEGITDLELPANKVIIAHTHSESCDTRAKCSFRVNLIQTLHMQSKDIELDIGYNFLVGGDGAAYEGRGWDKEGAHTRGFNKRSIGVAFIGSFVRLKPNAKQLQAAKLLLEQGVQQGKLAPDYKLYGARQLSETESPGETLYEIIKTWPHWSDEM